LEHAAEAFLSMLGGGNVGKMLVRLDSSVTV
jgi:NADPH-dependent curcumin reductase CurA